MNAPDRLILPKNVSAFTSLRSMTFPVRIGALATFGCACALALAALVDARPAQRATFRATVTAQIAKSWDYVSAGQAGDCTTTTRVKGSRVVTLRSARPTRIVVTGTPSRVRFAPALLRSVTARTTQGGEVTVDERGLGCRGRVHTVCPTLRRTLANQTVRFFRSRPGEISFRPSRDFAAGLPRTCPLEHPEVQAERPGLRDAQGRLSERVLFDRRARSQTASGASDEVTEISGNPDGRVVARVSWTIRFARVG
jgi:hypothetical protein